MVSGRGFWSLVLKTKGANGRLLYSLPLTFPGVNGVSNSYHYTSISGHEILKGILEVFWSTPLIL